MSSLSADPESVVKGADVEGAHDASAPGRNERRNLLKAGAIAAAAFFVPSIARGQSARMNGPGPGVHHPSSPGTTVGMNAIDPAAAWVVPELRLARRITMGLTDAEATLAKQMGYSDYLEYRLADETIDDSTVNSYVTTTFPLTTQGVATLYNADTGQVQTQLTNAMMYRGAFSAQQLKQRLVEFWTDHFNIAISKVGYLKVVDDSQVIRQYAMTSFPQLLRASAHSPAMLTYLDQTESRSGAPNQNYAREIMELHTLGVNGGYTQTDVAELSRVLTGWTVAGKGTFSFAANLHDFGAKTVLGMQIPASSPSSGAAGQAEGEAVLNLLAAHPSTATFISTKMLEFFLRYDPSDEQIAAVAGVYASTQGDIKSMLRVVLSQENLMAAPAKYKRPYHYVMSGVRAIGPTVTNAGSIASQVTNAGQQPFSWQTPDGFPDSAEYWSGNILPRWNFAWFVTNANSATTVKFDPTPFMTPATAAAIVNAIDRFVFGGEMTARLRSELMSYVGTSATSATRVRETIGLALASSTFQWY